MIMGISIALVLIILTFMPDILKGMDDEKPQDGKKKAKGKKSGKRSEEPREEQ